MTDWKGFWSYVHRDNAIEGGRILGLRQDLMDRVEFRTASGIEIFGDRPDIHWGDDWEERLTEALLETTFLIPIVTPSYFKSDYCRKELLRFSSSARSLRLEGLILPIYYADVPELENYVEGEDEVVDLIVRHQWEDFREAALEDRESAKYRKAVHRLAGELAHRASVADAKPTPIVSSTGSRGDGAPDEDGPGGRAHGAGGASDTLVEPSAEQEEEAGFLELLAEGEAALPKVPLILDSMLPILDGMGQAAIASAEEIGKSDAEGRGFAGRLQVSRRFAERLSEFADELEPLVKDYIANLLLVDPMVQLLFRFLEESGNAGESQELIESIRSMAEASIESLGTIDEFIGRLRENAKFSKDLKGPSRRIEVALRQLSESREMYKVWLRLANESGL